VSSLFKVNREGKKYTIEKYGKQSSFDSCHLPKLMVYAKTGQ
jgi:hypothetical protein